MLNPLKQFLWKFTLVKKIVSKTYNFLCIITPVFDPAYDAVSKLVAELQSQTFGRFIHVMISNGSSPKMKAFVIELNKRDPRFIYDEIEEETIHNPEELRSNICKRRDYGLKKYDAERYLLLDADHQIIDKTYFMKLYKAHREIKRDILITLIKLDEQNNAITLPIFPIEFAHIDLSNYTVSKRIAKKFNYPIYHDTSLSQYGSDYEFFASISNENNTALLNFISTIRDGHNSYKKLRELLNPK